MEMIGLKYHNKVPYKIISYVIYPFDVLVSFHKDFNELKAILEKRLPKDAWKDISEFEGEYDARSVRFETGQTVICFKKLTNDIIAHEIFHAVELLMEYIGIQLSRDSSEAYAYLIGYLTNEIYKLLDF